MSQRRATLVAMRRDPLAAHRRALGRYGEELAARWYQERGYEIVARNWSCRVGEVDIVARKGDEYVFCEVKTRSSAAFGLPSEAVGYTKQARLRRLAATWLAEERRNSVTGRSGTGRQGEAGTSGGRLSVNSIGSKPASAGQARPLRGGGPHRVRFDVAGVLAGRLEVIEGAF